MRVGLMRHGYAGQSIPDDPKADDARELTPQGRAAAQAAARWMLDEELEPDVIYAGPAARTMQTAKVVGEIVGARVVREPRLYAGGPMTVVLRELADDGEKRVLLVTHDDVVENSLHKLAEASGQVVDKIAMAEVRVVDFDRSTLEWEVRDAAKPSDLGGEDVYDHRKIVTHT